MNIFGHCLKFMSWGESHGVAIGGVLDGFPGGVSIDEIALIERMKQDVPDKYLGTKRQEKNQVVILSGLQGSLSLGTPIAFVIPNRDARSSAYSRMSESIRPGHGDFTYKMRYGIVETKGGGRASGRECAARLAAGELSRQLINTVFPNIIFRAEVIKMAGLKISTHREYRQAQLKALEISKTGDSSGGEVLLRIFGLPAGLGQPVFDKIESRLAAALLSLGAVKSFEIGTGYLAADLLGSQNNDGYTLKSGPDGAMVIGTRSNSAGGCLAGITTGEVLEIRISVKATPTISKKQRTISNKGLPTQVSYHGRYDKNITPRIAPLAEAMAQLVIADELIAGGFIHPTNAQLSRKEYPQSISCLPLQIGERS